MKPQTIVFVILGFFGLGICLEGRPVRQWLDNTTEHPPARYGYDISRKDQEGQCHFTVLIAADAVNALEKATLFWLAERPAKELPLPASAATWLANELGSEMSGRSRHEDLKISKNRPAVP